MKILLDECLPYGLVDALREVGHDVIHVYDLGIHGRPDDEVMAAARRDRRALMTADTDFGDILAASHEALPSVVIFRIADLRVGNLQVLLDANLHELETVLESGAILIISDTKIRYRQLPI